MPLPDRETIKADLISLMRERGAVSSTEAYATLSKTWRLTSKEKAAVRGGRSLYEHEIRWARQELVIEGVIQNTEASGRAIWRLVDSSVHLAPAPSDGSLSRMLEGFLDPSMWFLCEWLPRYEQAVGAVKRALAEERIDDAVDIIWLQQDNSVSNAGLGVLSKREIERHRSYFRSVTRRIARNPSPEMFDEILAEAERQRGPRRLTKVPRLLIARAFTTIAPDQYHTTVDQLV